MEKSNNITLDEAFQLLINNDDLKKLNENDFIKMSNCLKRAFEYDKNSKYTYSKQDTDIDFSFDSFLTNNDLKINIKIISIERRKFKEKNNIIWNN